LKRENRGAGEPLKRETRTKTETRVVEKQYIFPCRTRIENKQSRNMDGYGLSLVWFFVLRVLLLLDLRQAARQVVNGAFKFLDTSFDAFASTVGRGGHYPCGCGGTDHTCDREDGGQAVLD
jgi:hypothetical protein